MLTPLTILVVDDEEFIRTFLSTILTRRGHTVRLAGSVAEARRELGEHPGIECVMLDDHLPDGGGLTGADLSWEFKDRRPEIGIVLMSGDVMNLRPHRAGFVLAKPFGFEQISAALSRACPIAA